MPFTEPPPWFHATVAQDGKPMVLHLWGHEWTSSEPRQCALPSLRHGKAEVSEHDDWTVQKDVLWLDIPVDYACRMQGPQCREQRRCHKPGDYSLVFLELCEPLLQVPARC